MTRKVSLTGDRPTGCLHLGHYAGSLCNRLSFQHTYDQYILIADFQGISSSKNISDFIVKDNIMEVMRDYLSIGLEPKLNTFFVQSSIPALYEITSYYSMLVSMSRLQRNPTLKQELIEKNYTSDSPVAFFCHPINQAADITALQADVVPIGEDQKPLIEQCNEIVMKFNTIYTTDILKKVTPVISSTGRLSGIDGQGKASKSLNNCIFLSDPIGLVREKIFKMYTDPNHIYVKDPGKIEGHVVFEYLDAFYSNIDHLQELKNRYTSGGLGDIYLKNLLFDILEAFLSPIREKRKNITDEEIYRILYNGNIKANLIANDTLYKIRQAIGIFKIDDKSVL